MPLAPSLNADAFRRAHSAMLAREAQARRGALAALGAATVARMVTMAATEARDTQRYLRGLVMIHNDIVRQGGGAGVAALPIPPVLESRFSKRNRARLIKQRERWSAEVKRWEHNVESYALKGPGFAGWPSYREAQRTLEKARKQLTRAEAQVEAIDRDGRAAVIGGARGKNIYAARRLTRALLPFYGGDAVILDGADGQSRIVAAHREPHARIVEARRRIIARAMGIARSAGLVRGAAGTFIRALRAQAASGGVAA